MGNKHGTIPAVANLDLNRFGGNWYPIANIPLGPEKHAFNSLEHYDIKDGNRYVDVTFSYNEYDFNGPRKVLKSKGLVSRDPARWDIQFLWPLRAEYVVSYINDDYTQTIISRSRRDYVWIMARTASIDSESLENLKAKVKEQGYDLSQLKMVPQQARTEKS